MDQTRIPHTPNDALQRPYYRQTWQQLADEHAQLEILELQDRVRDLEEERDRYRECLQQALHALHHVTCERDRLRQSVRELRALMHRAAQGLDRRVA